MNLIKYLNAQRDWSSETFGPIPEVDRTRGITDHIRKELVEIEEDHAAGKDTLEEWVDVFILACDGLWRTGHKPKDIAKAIMAKFGRNVARKWPDWRALPQDKAIEHVREEA